jgi:cytochrome c oxidase subunit 4
VAAALIGLLSSNLLLANLSLGGLQPLLIVAIAGAQAGLVLWYAMDARRQEGLVKLFALVGLFFIAVMQALTMVDYLAR